MCVLTCRMAVLIESARESPRLDSLPHRTLQRIIASTHTPAIPATCPLRACPVYSGSKVHLLKCVRSLRGLDFAFLGSNAGPPAGLRRISFGPTQSLQHHVVQRQGRTDQRRRVSRLFCGVPWDPHVQVGVRYVSGWWYPQQNSPRSSQRAPLRCGQRELLGCWIPLSRYRVLSEFPRTVRDV